MPLKKGIERKTFLYSVLLILLVTIISFAFMYFMMPGYYHTQKGKTLQNNLSALSRSLVAAQTEEECAELISDFSGINNVTVLSFDENDVLLPAISTPFLGMRGGDAAFYTARQLTDREGRETYQIIIQGEQLKAGEERIAKAVPEEGGKVTIQWAGQTSRDLITFNEKVGTDIVDHLIVSGTLQPIDEAKGVILSLIPYVLAIAIVMGLVLSGFYARQFSKPILQISEAALRMQRMEPDAVSGLKTGDELGQLSANLDVLYADLLDNIGHLKNEMDKVNSLERSKTEMMQSASHELKTPIAALSGMIEGMIDNVGAYKNKEKYLVECKGQVDKLSYLVSEILGASRADMAGNELEMSETFADELIRRAIAENAYQIHEKGLRLEQVLPPAKMTTDPNVLYHAVSNLVSNAVRYTPAGGEIRVIIAGEGAERRFSIENECEPIPPEELTKIFEPFYTRSFSRDKTKSGTGLGLYIVKRSLERLMIPYDVTVTDLGFKISMTI